MSWTLLLRLAGPMQAWGVQSRFEIRESGTEPSKSGVVGLICAALGIDRNDPIPGEIRALRMGVRADREGQMRRDYHTTVRWKWDRRAGAWEPGGTALSERYFLADASFLVGLECEDEALLRRIGDAIDHPRWPLCLGRRACPPSRPIRVKDGLRSGTLEEVLRSAAWEDRAAADDGADDDTADDVDATRPENGVDPDAMPARLRTVIEVGGAGTIGEADGLVLARRPDQPISFAPRNFAMREVRIGTVTNPARKEADHAHQ